jgi:hypothetical protein
MKKKGGREFRYLYGGNPSAVGLATPKKLKSTTYFSGGIKKG